MKLRSKERGTFSYPLVPFGETGCPNDTTKYFGERVQKKNTSAGANLTKICVTKKPGEGFQYLFLEQGAVSCK